MFHRACLFLLLAALPSAAFAQERDYCPDRPGIAAPTCTMAPGRISFEAGLGDWTLSRDAAEREDVVVTGDFLLRLGIADHAEVQLGWTSLGFSRTRDRAAGDVEHRTGTGDVMLALRRNLANPDGAGFSAAVMPFLSLPAGRRPIGAGDWGTGLRVPLSYEVSSAITLEMMPEVDAEANEGGKGRHLVLGEVVGLAAHLNDALTATAEYQFRKVDEPGDHHGEHTSGFSIAWQTSDRFQVDLGVNAGLDHDADDLEVYMGISRRF
ncbi:transporter [Novosphingobium lindaniclasticum]|uniref:Transporter n=1 Tax=Novosphingobium lindaniclasticum LE124 TaxID=1096930 RepID=T0HT82_9SPHN|nr:transporter [Novosphingobium lindaniclasticum]EQB15303.1 hypothetical protein L284_11750 [Novosphingobium lindaniclasticum LE124]